jgi:transposase InsO family protein
MTWHKSVNAALECFFGSLKQERMHWRNYQTRYEAQQNILDYISMFYNNYCLLSTVGYVSSNDYERLLTEIKEAS